MVTEEIKQLLAKTLSEIGYPIRDLHIEHPQNSDHGDFATPVALQLAKQLGKNPREVADQIAQAIKNNQPDYIADVTVAGPGFINIRISPQSLADNISNVISKEKIVIEPRVGSDTGLEMIENTGPNTNKPLHIGHVRNTTLGISLVALRKAIGANVWSANINNDRGAHICKAMLGYLVGGRDAANTATDSSELLDTAKNWQSLLEQWSQAPEKWKQPEAETEERYQKPDHFVGRYYIVGNDIEEANEQGKLVIAELLQAWEANNEQVHKLWQTMNNWFYEGFKQTHARILGISPSDQQFDKEWYESELYKPGKDIVMANLGNGIFAKRPDGAIVAKLEKYNLPDKVVIRSDGTALYATQDIELSRQRVAEEKATLDARVVASEQELYFKQLFAMCQELGFGTLENYKHISYGMVNLKGGEKMSSRKGTVVYADDLMDMVKEKVIKAFPEVKADVAEAVALGAIKYSMLKYNPKAEIEFSIEESISLNGSSGPYLQYTYARIRSLLEKASQAGVADTVSWSDQLATEEINLLRILAQFEEVVLEAAEGFAPQLLCNYLFDLAQQYNLFYQKLPVLNAGDPVSLANRVFLTRATGVILKKGLDLLTIATPERM